MRLLRHPAAKVAITALAVRLLYCVIISYGIRHSLLESRVAVDSVDMRLYDILARGQESYAGAPSADVRQRG